MSARCKFLQSGQVLPKRPTFVRLDTKFTERRAWQLFEFGMQSEMSPTEDKQLLCGR